MTLEIRKTRQAEKDLIGIWHYSFDNWGERQADKYHDYINRNHEQVI